MLMLLIFKFFLCLWNVIMEFVEFVLVYLLRIVGVLIFLGLWLSIFLVINIFIFRLVWWSYSFLSWFDFRLLFLRCLVIMVEIMGMIFLNILWFFCINSLFLFLEVFGDVWFKNLKLFWILFENFVLSFVFKIL